MEMGWNSGPLALRLALLSTASGSLAYPACFKSYQKLPPLMITIQRCELSPGISQVSSLQGHSNCGRLFLTMVPARISTVPLPAFLLAPRKQVILTAFNRTKASTVPAVRESWRQDQN